MQRFNTTASRKAERGDDTSRSSSKGQKLSSGGRPGKKSNSQNDEAIYSPVSGSQKKKRIGEKRKA